MLESTFFRPSLHVQPLHHAGAVGPRPVAGDHRRESPPGRAHRADRLGELREPRGHGGAGDPAHQQVCRGLPWQALLRRLRVCRHRRTARRRPRAKALPCGGRECPAAFGRAGQPGGLFRGAFARRHDPRHEPAAWRAPDARLAGQPVGQVVQGRCLWARAGNRADRLRGGRAPRARAQAQAHHRRRIGLFARDRMEAVSRDRRRDRGAVHGRHGALRGTDRGRGLSDPRRHRRFRNEHDAQDAARSPWRVHPDEGGARRRSTRRCSRGCRAAR